MKVVAVHCFACCLSFVFVLVLFGVGLEKRAAEQIWGENEVCPEKSFGGRCLFWRESAMLNFLLQYSTIHRNLYKFLHTDSDT